MRIFLSNRIFLLFIILGSFLTVTLFTISCAQSKSDVEAPPDRDRDRDRDRDDDDDDDDDDVNLSCRLPKCSGSKCCDEKNEDCEDYCDEDLDLSGDGLDRCYELKESVAKEIAYLFDETINDADEEELRKIRSSNDVDLICGAVKELGDSVLEDRIDDYGSSNARALLGWIGETKTAYQIFDKNGEEGRDLFEKLLIKAGTGSGDSAVLDALGQEKVSLYDNNDEELPIMPFAVEEERDDLVKFIHDEIIKDDKDGICGKSSNWPELDKDNDGVDHVYNTGSSGTDTKDGDEVIDEAEVNESREEAACILAVYCSMDATTIDDASSDTNKVNEDFRKELAEIENESIVKNLIKSSHADGGLGLDQDDADDLTNRACACLDQYWNAQSSGITWPNSVLADTDGAVADCNQP